MLGVLGQPAIREQGLQGNRVARGDSRGQKARQGDVVGKGRYRCRRVSASVEKNATEI